MDWTPVLIKKKVSKPKVSFNPEVSRIQRLEDDEIMVKPKMFSQESRNKIVQFRITNNISQIQFDTMCSFPRNTIQQLESNKKAPSQKELQTLNRVLKTGLTLAN